MQIYPATLAQLNPLAQLFDAYRVFYKKKVISKERRLF